MFYYLSPFLSLSSLPPLTATLQKRILSEKPSDRGRVRGKYQRDRNGRNGVQEVLLERKKGEEGRGERRFADNPDMLRLLEPRIDKKKTPSSHALVPLTLLTTFVPSLASSASSSLPHIFPCLSQPLLQKPNKRP